MLSQRMLCRHPMQSQVACRKQKKQACGRLCECFAACVRVRVRVRVCVCAWVSVCVRVCACQVSVCVCGCLRQHSCVCVYVRVSTAVCVCVCRCVCVRVMCVRACLRCVSILSHFPFWRPASPGDPEEHRPARAVPARLLRGSFLVWNDGYFGLYHGLRYLSLRIMPWLLQPGLLGPKPTSRTFRPNRFGDNENDPVRARAALRAWTLWRMRSAPGFLQGRCAYGRASYAWQ